MLKAFTAVVVLLTIAIAACVGSSDDTIKDWQPSIEFSNTQEKIIQLAKGKDAKPTEKEHQLDDLEKLGREIEVKWRDNDAESYGRLILQLCRVIVSSNEISGSRTTSMAQDFAMRALDKSNDMPLDVQCNLLDYVHGERDARGQLITAEDKTDLRKKIISLRLRAIQRVLDTIDPTWNPHDAGVGNVTPPDGQPAGVVPSSIADPKLRAKYEADIAANRKKILKAEIQMRARDLKEHWIPDAEKYIVLSYNKIPDKIGELESLLDENIQDKEIRMQIMTIVENQKKP